MRLKNFDFLLLLFVSCLIFFGIMVIYSASYNPNVSLKHSFAFKQFIWFSIGFFICIAVSFIDYKLLGKLCIIFYLIEIALLGLVMIKGITTLGAQRWISVAGFKLQPSEFAKIIIIITLAQYLTWDNKNKNRLGYIIATFAIAFFPLILIIKQPDLGTALVCVPTIFIMLFASGARFKYLMTIILLGILIMPLGWFFLKDYQKKRIEVFINPNVDPLGSGYTIIQSKIAIGSGGLYGQGWRSGTQTRLKFLPERHTDFIFSVIGEEWGFAGSIVTLMLFLFILRRGLRIAEASSDLFGKLVAVGIVCMIFSHIIINVGMTVGVMPITGLPLPFLSYGGSSMITMMLCIGILESIYLNRFMFR